MMTIPFSSLILIGFMGAGKSSIGKQLAQQLQYDYIDTDALIIAKTGRSIATLFETEGETRFRQLEAEVLSDLQVSLTFAFRSDDVSQHHQPRKSLQNLIHSSSERQTKFVLSTGGGTILSEENRRLLKSLGTIIWLNASPNVLFERAARQSRRPLLDVEYPRNTFNRLLAKRLPFYLEICNFEIDSTKLSYPQTIDCILRTLSSTSKNLSSKSPEAVNTSAASMRAPSHALSTHLFSTTLQ